MANWTVEQLTSAFEEVATSANALAEFARSAGERAGVSEAASDFQVVTMLVERLGVLADYMCQNGVVGDQGAWILGRAFHSSEVGHG